MSYLHCPTCKRAYNVATSTQCPNCPVPATLVDPAEDIVAAAELLARAMARATPDERDDAMGRMDRLALPAPGAKPVTFHGAMIRSIREALEPTMAPPPPKPQRLVTAIALSLIDRVVDHPRALEMRERASRLVARKAPRLWNRVRALSGMTA
jgi:hypothetical protein